MKKLKLKTTELGSAEVLSRAQLKHVLIGVVGGTTPSEEGTGGGVCAAGQHLYTCTVQIRDCGSVTGGTCASSTMEAVSNNAYYWGNAQPWCNTGISIDCRY